MNCLFTSNRFLGALCLGLVSLIIKILLSGKQNKGLSSCQLMRCNDYMHARVFSKAPDMAL